MFGWWKKNEGFEWREYVRTTILLKRKNRRDRVVAAKDQAVAGAKRVGAAGAVAGRQGARQAWSGLVAGFGAGAGAVAKGSAAALAWIGQAPWRVGAALGPLLGAAQWRAKPLARRLTASPLRGIIFYGGLIALIVTLAWLPFRGLGPETLIAGEVAALLLGVLLAARLVAEEQVLPAGADAILARVPEVSPKVVGAAVLAVLAVLGGGLAVSAWNGGGLSTVKFAALQIPGFKPSEVISGRASALDGDTIRIGQHIIQLDGVEAPDREQVCSRPGNKRWRCGTAAREALARLIGREAVTCQVSSAGEGQRKAGVCRIGGSDLAEVLARNGHVFAKAGLFAPYVSAEDAARAAKAGLWRGTADRPQAWRDRLWAEAKRSAPEGCPIKGQVRSGEKVYLLPWSPRYERVKVRERRGERWFCSESEARQAGWTPSERS